MRRTMARTGTRRWFAATARAINGQLLAVLTISANVTRNPISTIISMSVTVTRMLISRLSGIAISSAISQVQLTRDLILRGSTSKRSGGLDRAATPDSLGGEMDRGEPHR